MEYCYLCDTTFTELNNSVEHILLNSIGGRLKTRNLLCKKCNSDFGSEADQTLAKELSFLSSFLEVKRDKGKVQDIKGGKTHSGTTYNLIGGHKPQISKPIITEPTTDNPLFNIRARDKAEALSVIAGLKRNHPTLDDTNIDEKLYLEEYYVQDSINFKFGVGSVGTFRSLTKSAVNYFIHLKKDASIVSHLFQYLKAKEHLKVAKHFLAVDLDNQHGVSHTIHLESNKNLLYCYIELFSAYSFIVLLADKYSGEKINSTYSYDLINNVQLQRELNLTLTLEAFDFSASLTTDDVAVMQKRLNRIMSIGEKIKTDREILNIIDDGFEKVMAKFGHPEVFSKEMHHELSFYISNRFTQFLHRGTGNDLNQVI